jgi:secreted trypsin-like serine protease
MVIAQTGVWMNLRRLSRAGALAVGLLVMTATPSSAIVGGTAASPGEFPAIARVSYGAFLCSGTLIAPDTVLTAGHCSSVTGAAVASPIGWPAPLINVRIGGTTASTGEQATVSTVTIPPSYLAGDGNDISLLKLTKASTKAPVKVAGSAERSIWNAGTLETIVGWGVTQEGGSTPATLQKGQVPITTDAYCAGAYSNFDPATMVCAGFPQGGVDTCQGDSGGPMFGQAADASLRVVGSTSFGEGCARPGKPGVYARVADTPLREWIRSQAPAGVN